MFNDQFSDGWSLRFQGVMYPLGELLYKWLRRELVHEGGLPAGLQIDPNETTAVFTLSLVESLPLTVPATWYHSFIINVIGHPVNADQFPPQDQTLRAAIERRERAGQRMLGPYVKPRSYEP